MQKLDPRSSQPIGADPLGNVYYILPRSGEGEELVGYASWVLCQKGAGLDHPLGEEWVETEGDGGSMKEFYAIDGAEAVAVLAEWIRGQTKGNLNPRYEAPSPSDRSEGGHGETATGRATTAGSNVLVEKLQQFSRILQANAELTKS
ncbi:hypothetical protein DRE_05259 [Drechslerella stenobrocha 248]|uniref:Uncharacterized protein n=1 Tax=Drechslerella stenobrocha 248 TaxID=1043628 RepID=W7I0F5_9PEZI|nr:hypothetical protein DRE_05259 [Drechslerella stenobrocha 248]